MTTIKVAEVPGDKWQIAAERAMRTARWAKTMTKVLISHSNADQPSWHVINFVGPNKAECRGIVDLLAIRKDHQDHDLPLKRGDLFEIVLIQVKGGRARWPTADDRERLRRVQKKYGARDVVLSEWKQGSRPTFYRLSGDEWNNANPADIFCPDAKKANGKRVSDKKRPGSTSVVSSASRPFGQTKSVAAVKAWATRQEGQVPGTKDAVADGVD